MTHQHSFHLNRALIIDGILGIVYLSIVAHKLSVCNEHVKILILLRLEFVLRG